jgi:hypothetical protein
MEGDDDAVRGKLNIDFDCVRAELRRFLDRLNRVFRRERARSAVRNVEHTQFAARERISATEHDVSRT